MGDLDGDYVGVVVAAFRSLVRSHDSDGRFTSDQVASVAHDLRILEREWFTERLEILLIKDLNFLIKHHWQTLAGSGKELDSNIRGILR